MTYQLKLHFFGAGSSTCIGDFIDAVGMVFTVFPFSVTATSGMKQLLQVYASSVYLSSLNMCSYISRFFQIVPVQHTVEGKSVGEGYQLVHTCSCFS